MRKTVIASVLLICLLMPLVAVGCKKEKKDFLLFDGEALTCEIVLPKAASEQEREAANAVATVLHKKTGLVVACRTDDAEPAAENAIVIGNTSCESTQSLTQDMRYGDWGVRRYGNQIAALAWTTGGMSCAVEELLRYLNGAESTEDGELLLRGTVDTVETHTEWTLPYYAGGKMQQLYDCGDGARMAYFKSASAESLAAYVSDLVASGYTQSNAYTRGGNSFWELRNDTQRVFAYYTAAYGEARLICDTYLNDSSSTPQTGTVETALFTSCSDAKGPYMLRLSDNSLIVFDGYLSSQNPEMSNQLSTLYNEMTQICGSDEIRITAWFLSHVHWDHTATFVRLMESKYAAQIRLERVICNVSSEADTVAMGEWAEGEYDYYKRVLTAVNKYNANRTDKTTVIKTHTGEVFDFCGARFEILYTHEDYLPRTYPIGGAHNGNGINSHSLVMRMSYGEHVVIWTGDMSNEAGDVVLEMYGESLKADIVQVAHHGNNTCGKPSFYLACDPEILLWTWDQVSFEDNVVKYNRGGKAVVDALGDRIKRNIFLNGTAVEKLSLR